MINYIGLTWKFMRLDLSNSFYFISNDSHVFANCHEGIHSLLNLFLCMGPRKLTSDSCLSSWNNREAESNNINVILFHHCISHPASNSGVTKIYRSDWAVIMTQDVEPSLFHLCPEQCGIGWKILDEILVFTQHFEYFQRSTNHRWGNGIGVEIWSTFLTQNINYLLACSSIASGTTA